MNSKCLPCIEHCCATPCSFCRFTVVAVLLYDQDLTFSAGNFLCVYSDRINLARRPEGLLWVNQGFWRQTLPFPYSRSGIHHPDI